jgi:predicted nucleotidyltransferase
MRRDEALRLLAEHRDELVAMGAGSLSLFGSVARDEAGPDSDIDILIELGRPMGAFGLAAIHLRLEEILERRVELITRNSLIERYRVRIEPDLVRAT